LFGISVASLKSLSATFSILAIVGLGLLTRLLAGGPAARLAMVAAALSPWSFQVSRLAVDAPMTPALVVWGVYLFLRSRRARWGATAGVVLTIAAYTYSPVRVLVIPLSILLLLIERKRLTWTKVVAFFGSAFVLGLPLAMRILDGTVLGRARALSIFSAEYIDTNRGHLGRVTFVVKQALENLFEHLRPSYLFFTGDSNIRHSTQIMGELGWLDIFAVACFGVAVGTLIWRAFRPAADRQGPPSRRWLVAGVAIVVGAFGTLPSALCWEGLPHALRSMPIWPAVSLFSGATLSAVWFRSRLIAVVALALAVGQTVHFFPYYFRVYPKASYAAWSGDLFDAAKSRDPAKFAAVAKGYPDLGFRYYLIRYFGESCASSRERARQILNGP
jgi:4-amino-4-deoxy-L-arabinose transferase-like glycosyltransferase